MSAAGPDRARAGGLEIVMVTRRPPEEHGGVERVVRGLTDELRRRRPGWRTGVISAFSGAGALEGLDGVSDVVAALRLGWRVTGSRADVAFVHCPECLWGIRLVRRLLPLRGRGSGRGRSSGQRRGPRLVAVWHGAGPEPYLVLRPAGDRLAAGLAAFRCVEERRALAADGHIAVHRVIEHDLRRIYGLRAPVTVIQNALDDDLLRRLQAPAPPRPPHASTAVWIGQAGHRKGLDVALAAVALARREVPGLRLLVAGVRPGESVEGVDWLGVLPPQDVAGLYRRADLLLFPTRYESFGLVVIEAMAAGLPVVVSDAVPDGIVEDGRNGIVVTGHDPAPYAAALVRLFSDDALREAMAAAGPADAARFSQGPAAERYAEVAEGLAGR